MTNNLYRENWKRKTDNMLQGPSPNGASHPEAPRFYRRGEGSRVQNPELRHFAPLTPYSVRFCPQLLAAQDFAHTPAYPQTRNRLKAEILDITYEKKLILISPATERSLTPYRHPPRLRV